MDKFLNAFSGTKAIVFLIEDLLKFVSQVPTKSALAQIFFAPNMRQASGLVIWQIYEALGLELHNPQIW